MLCALTLDAEALVPGEALPSVAYSLFNLFNGASWPLRQQLMHEHTTSAQRSTTVSAKSLALMLGGLLGSLLHPRIAEGLGYPAGFLAAAACLLLIAVASLGLRDRRTAPPAPESVGTAAVG